MNDLMQVSSGSYYWIFKTVPLSPSPSEPKNHFEVGAEIWFTQGWSGTRVPADVSYTLSWAWVTAADRIHSSPSPPPPPHIYAVFLWSEVCQILRFPTFIKSIWSVLLSKGTNQSRCFKDTNHFETWTCQNGVLHHFTYLDNCLTERIQCGRVV